VEEPVVAELTADGVAVTADVAAGEVEIGV
jgi:hypothetical protein